MARSVIRLAVIVMVVAPAVAVAQAADGPEWGGTWQSGPTTGFNLTRLDGAYVASTGLVYFLGGRTGTERMARSGPSTRRPAPTPTPAPTW